MKPKLTWKLLCCSGWPHASDGPVSAFWALNLQTCTSRPGFFFFNFFLSFWPSIFFSLYMFTLPLNSSHS